MQDLLDALKVLEKYGLLDRVKKSRVKARVEEAMEGYGRIGREKVLQIRKLHDQGWSRQEIAEELSVAYSTVARWTT